MRDRGTLLAGAGIAAAFLIAGVFFLFWQGTQRAREAELEARFQAENMREMQQLKMLETRPVAVEINPDDATLAGVSYLIERQSEDGAWRSDLYATFKDGPALTPLVVCALQEAGVLPGVPLGRDPIRAGCEYLAKLVNADGSIKGGEGELDYPVYSAALTVKALSHPEYVKDFLKARDAWLKFLLDRQLTEKLGWKLEDKQYGGWGYCRFIPKKPEPGAIAPPLIESNLSATLFALEAMKAAGVKDLERNRAEMFIRHCQNDDGGFHFIYDDPVRNKAGSEAGRFNSYGSTTADGLRAMLLIGKPLPHPVANVMARVWQCSVNGAKNWLIQNFRPDSHPGKYIEAQEHNREAVYFYYAASVSKALRAAGVAEAGGKPWATSLATELVKRQRPDGSWMNPVELVRENEPLVATANAVIALANCKAVP